MAFCEPFTLGEKAPKEQMHIKARSRLWTAQAVLVKSNKIRESTSLTSLEASLRQQIKGFLTFVFYFCQGPRLHLEDVLNLGRMSFTGRAMPPASQC